MKYFVVALVFLLSTPVSAAFMSVKSDLTTAHSGVSHDPVTGKFYQSDSYFNDQIRVFANEADFRNNIVEKTLNIAQRGTYFEVIGGKFYTRNTTNTASIAVFDAETGTLLQASNVGQLNPINGSGGFNWGGYSSMNFIADGLDLYLFGKSTISTEYLLLKMNQSDLSVDSVIATGMFNSLGYAAMVNGVLFASTSYHLTQFDYRFDLDQSTLSNINFDFSLDSANFAYLTHLNYVQESDTLYLNDYNSRKTFELANASQSLNAPIKRVVNSVPAPASLAIFAFALLVIRRFKR